MPGENLTRLEASERKAILDVTSYDVTLDLTTGPETFRSTTIVRFRALGAHQTFIDAITAKVHAVTLNGRTLDPSAVSTGTRILLDGLEENNELVVDADAFYTNTGEGLHRFVDPADGEVYFYSQFEVPDSRRVFAVFEQPDLKASFTFHVTAPSNWVVVSNSTTPDPQHAGENRGVWHFAPTQPISSYITAIIAGPYQAVHSELTSSDGRVIPLGIYARRSLAKYLDPDNIFDTTRKGFAYYEEKFGYPYPFPKYDQLFVPEFNAGAMENAGAVTITETYVFRSKVSDAIRERRVVTILHELAHMWFGDLVTMKWWNDLWLNESFAEWASTMATAEATEWTDGWTTFQASEKSWAYEQDQLPSTHPVVANIPDLEAVQVNFDGITYAKGGSVLKQLAAWVGTDAFFAGVGAYFHAHEYGNTELKDLLAELETASGRDLSNWSAQWLETAGVATLTTEIETDEADVITSFAIAQTTHPDYPTLRPHRIAVGFYSAQGDEVVRVRRTELDIDGERTEIPELVGETRPDLVLINDDDLAYAKIRLDAASIAFAIEHLAEIDDSLARAVIWNAMWDATRDAETPARDFVQLVLNNIGPETASTMLRTVLGQLVTVARAYTSPATRNSTIELVGDRLWELASAAKPGSDSQFQFVKFFAQIASTPAHAAILAELRDGTRELPGLTTDTDLEWELLTGLVLTGAAGEAEIEAAHEADQTSTGAQAAAQASAAIPTAEHKLATFEELVGGSQPNVVVRAAGTGFRHVNDPSILEGVVAPYFAAIDGIWRDRPYAIANYLIRLLYPTPLYSAGLLTATDAWLASTDAVPALRRIVIESRAVVERALAAQARDAV